MLIVTPNDDEKASVGLTDSDARERARDREIIYVGKRCLKLLRYDRLQRAKSEYCVETNV